MAPSQSPMPKRYSRPRPRRPPHTGSAFAEPKSTNRASSRRSAFNVKFSAAEDIPLALPCPVRRPAGGPGDIADIHQIQTGIDIRRHRPLKIIDDDLPGRRRLEIVLAHRRGWIHYHDRQSCRGKLERHLLRQKLRPLVRTRHIVECHRTVLITFPAVRHPDTANRAGVHYPVNPASGRLRADCGFHLHSIDTSPPVSCPQAVVRGDMKHHAAPRPPASRIPESRRSPVTTRRLRVPAIDVDRGPGPGCVSPRYQHARHVPADESGRARHAVTGFTECWAVAESLRIRVAMTTLNCRDPHQHPKTIRELAVDAERRRRLEAAVHHAVLAARIVARGRSFPTASASSALQTSCGARR